ncbi:Lipid A biosynthesis lauroyl acyltransferase [hydrothermal vent metagenome]|uniref:Lipid A biosynthesis lauroyl acyltransferase n=1 Tax=hydrothermal vent metagenome TaxID=652676 RepID=A0A1W1EEF7_9ZZZZ
MRIEIEYLLVKLLLGIAKIIPKKILYIIMQYLVKFFYYLDSSRRNLTKKNLSMAFPEKTNKEIILLSKDVYLSLSKTITEILLMFTNRIDIDDMVINKEEAITQLNEISKKNKNGIIVITAHFSNWELAAHFLAKHGLPMLAVGREGNNTKIDQNITVPFRNKFGNHATTKSKAMLAMVKTLKKGGTVGLLIDQKSGHLNSVKVDFFNQLAETTLSVAILKNKLNPIVVPIFIARQKNGLYKMIINDPIDYVADEFEKKDEKLKAMTEVYSKEIEDVIREYPEQWFWMHNRWRR